MKKINWLLLLITFGVELFAFSKWLRCTNLQNLFHYSNYDVSLQVIDLIHTDQGVPLLITRVLHNKLIVSVIDVFLRFTHFLDPVLVTTFISFIGMLFFIYGIEQIILQRNKWIGLAIFFLCSVFFEIILHPTSLFPVRLFLLAAAFLSLTVFGNIRFMQTYYSKKVIIIWILLLLISLGWTVFLPSDLYRYCIQP